MVKAVMHGCNGHMGRVITDLCKDDKDIKIVAGVDKYTGVANDYPVFESIEKVDVDFDVIIDFSNVSAIDDLLKYCETNNKNVVLCTTGLSEEMLAEMAAFIRDRGFANYATMKKTVSRYGALLLTTEEVRREYSLISGR